MRPVSIFIALMAVIAVVLLWRSGWTPFPPSDYEECAENAAKSAKSKEALDILVASCGSKFVGRRNVRGGYIYYDGRQNRDFNIVGPNPSPGEWDYIEKQYAKHLDDVAAAEQAQRRLEAERATAQAEQARQVQLAQADLERRRQLAQADLERRRRIALPLISLTSLNISCLYPHLDGCPDYKLSASIENHSSESISALSLGWAFISEGDRCPSSVQTKTREQVRLRPGDTLVVNLHQRSDGPPTKKFRYCVIINDAEIAQ
jgi:hypothetical protein